ncbi:Uncharacterised protein [BD1-7 clade bacterium]|uniref:BIG2 domain-containing protein n=1 Tax=BD1-7 clade bacterium TaxID=2029982 RepID=A0A5S9P7I1_9GAMM|nr:Uncharacterised protein [BD1-7 clade bacterium]
MAIKTPRIDSLINLRTYLLALCTLLLASCNQENTPSDINDGSTINIDFADNNPIIGESLQPRVALIRPDGETVDISQSVNLETHHEKIVKKQDNGQLVAVAAGLADISTQYRGLSAISQVEVSSHYAKSVFIDTPHIHLLPSSSQKVSALAYLSNHTNKRLTNINWQNSAPDVASIDSQGIVTAKASGTARFQASFAGFTTELVVDVPDDQNLAGANLLLDTSTTTLPQEGMGFIRSYLELRSGSVIDVTDVTSWSVDDPAVFELNDIDDQMQIQPLAAGSAEVSAQLKISDLQLENRQVVSVSPAKLTHILISKNDIENGIQMIPDIPAGASAALTATAFFDNGQTLDVTRVVEWQADPQAPVHLIDSGENAGTVIALRPGMAAVSAGMNNEVDEAEILVSDTKVSNISIDATTPSTMLIGLPWRYTVTATYEDGTQTDVTEQAAWFSTNTDIAIINTYQDNPGLVVPLRTGSANIEAEFAGVKTSKTISVTDAYITGIKLTPDESLVLNPGELLALKANAVLADETLLDITHAVSWRSTDPSIVSVQSVYNSTPGELKAQSSGNAAISAVLNYVGSKSLPITVANGEIISVRIDPQTASIPLGASYQFRALASHKNGHSQDVSADTQWQSQDNDTLENLGEGMTKALRIGEAQMTADYKGFDSFANAKVVDAALDSIEILGDLSVPSDTTVNITDHLSARGIFTDGSYTDITDSVEWSTKNPIFLEIANNQSLLATGPGDADIAATYNGVSGVKNIAATPSPYHFKIANLEVHDTYYIVTLPDIENTPAFNGNYIQWDAISGENDEFKYSGGGIVEAIQGDSQRVKIIPFTPKVHPQEKQHVQILATCKRAYKVTNYNEYDYVSLETLEVGASIIFPHYNDADFTWEYEDGKYFTSRVTHINAHTEARLDLAGHNPPTVGAIMSAKLPGCDTK